MEAGRPCSNLKLSARRIICHQFKDVFLGRIATKLRDPLPIETSFSLDRFRSSQKLQIAAWPSDVGAIAQLSLSYREGSFLLEVVSCVLVGRETMFLTCQMTRRVF